MRKDSKYNQRIGLIKQNKWGDTMKIIDYIDANNIVVEFQDEYREKKKSRYSHFSNGTIMNPHVLNCRIGKENINHQGYKMKIVEYYDSRNVIVEFQDKHKTRIHTKYQHFESGNIKNPYSKSVLGVGMVGSKYPVKINNKHTKEYVAWRSMLCRCFDKKYKQKFPTYNNVTCCEEWLYFENFYEWLHNQPNFDKWFNGDKWAVDKDILVKGNKIYSPEKCCLVPYEINALFVRQDSSRGVLPIGVRKREYGYQAICSDPYTHKTKTIGRCKTIEGAFSIYKEYKENIIKQVAQEEYDKGNIIKSCYEAMINYKVEITD